MGCPDTFELRRQELRIIKQQQQQQQKLEDNVLSTHADAPVDIVSDADVVQSFLGERHARIIIIIRVFILYLLFVCC